MKILLIEDEPKVASFVKNGFCEEGHVVDVACDGEEGDILASVNEYDVIVMDIMLPKVNGFILCKRLRERGLSLPIIMLTARDAVADKVQGLEVGADDYLTKPFSFVELSARVRALARRMGSQKKSLTRLEIADLSLDIKTQKVFRGEKEIILSSKEYTLLQYFLENIGVVLTRTMIAEHVWDMHHDSLTNIVDVYVNYLRNKIDEGHETKLIHTVRGKGYLLKA